MRARGIRWLGGATAALLVFAAMFEIALRSAPEAIPLAALREFQPGLRSQIAAVRSLQRREDTLPIPRSDGGPPDRLWRFRPGSDTPQRGEEEGIVESVRVDGNGFCNAPFDAYDAPYFDLLTIGDSFTWCAAVGATDAWPTLIRQASGLTGYNLGLPARGLHEYVETLRIFGLKKQPRIVALNAYEGNDLRDAFFFHRDRADPDRPVHHPGCPFSSPALCTGLAGLRDGWLGRRSYALNLALGSLTSTALEREKREIHFRYDVRFADGEKVRFNSHNGDRDEVQFARWLADGTVHTSLLDGPLEAFSALAREHGFVPLLLYSPSAYTAYDAMAEFEDPGVGADLRTQSRRLREYFRPRAAELGIPFLDLTPILQEAAAVGGAEDRLYFRTNVHYTQRGHRVVADAVTRRIAQLALPERRRAHLTSPGETPRRESDPKATDSGPEG